MAEETTGKDTYGLPPGLLQGIADGVFERTDHIHGYHPEIGVVRLIQIHLGVITEEQAEKYGLQAHYLAQPEWMRSPSEASGGTGEEPPEE